MKYKLLIFFCCVALTCFSQDGDSESSSNDDRFFGGGNFGLSIGRFTLINVSPQIGYRFTEFFAAGAGLNLIYTSNKERDVYGNDYRKTVQGVTGFNVFARAFPARQFLVQVQPELNYIFGNVRYYQPPAAGKYKLDAEIVPSLLAGGGIVVPTGNGSLITTIMYDLLQRTNSPYGSRPVVNVGYNFNF